MDAIAAAKRIKIASISHPKLGIRSKCSNLLPVNYILDFRDRERNAEENAEKGNFTFWRRMANFLKLLLNFGGKLLESIFFFFESIIFNNVLLNFLNIDNDFIYKLDFQC